mmetsp:Transcript_7596/g.14042  ORF Transcript_7596/g.14042 Transcript_7596/m.14042 type:complete len:236 (-) Transcript_7596:148-855(-)
MTIAEPEQKQEPPQRSPPVRTPSVSGHGSDREVSIFANRNNSDFKWQRAKYVVGALEVKSEPVFEPRDDMLPRYKEGVEKTFEDALQAWEDLNLKQSFIKACDGLPAEVCCCGMVNDEDASIKQYVKLLNEGWVKAANKALSPRGLKIDIFLWNWQNASGKSETNILLIRFFELSTYKFRRASNQGSLDLNDMLVEEGDEIADDDQSHVEREKDYGVGDGTDGMEKEDDPSVVAA